MGQQAVTVTCDRCGKSFTPELKERPVSGGGAEQRFRCPHCLHWFSVAYITAAGLRIRQAIKAVEHEIVMKPDDVGLRDRLADLREQMRGEVWGPNDVTG